MLIAAHHFSIYPPLADAAMPIAGPMILWLQSYGRVAQVFFVISGFMLAGSMSHRIWGGRGAGRFILQRYCRLALPYLAAAAAAAAACAIGREWLDEKVVGSTPTIKQLVAHLFFLQDVLGYDSLSAGLWFVCINFQLTLIYLAGLLLRDVYLGGNPAWIRVTVARLPLALGWLFAGASLFYFNRDDYWDGWAAYFFGQFFLGVLVHHALRNPRAEKSLAIYVGLFAAALAIEWRWRLVVALATGLALFIGGKNGVLTSWPTSRAAAFLGKTSYSLFLIHFPVLVIVSTFWVQQEWTSPGAGMGGLVAAYAASVGAAALFYRFVEAPAMRLSKRFA